MDQICKLTDTVNLRFGEHDFGCGQLDIPFPFSVDHQERAVYYESLMHFIIKTQYNILSPKEYHGAVISLMIMILGETENLARYRNCSRVINLWLQYLIRKPQLPSTGFASVIDSITRITKACKQVCKSSESKRSAAPPVLGRAKQSDQACPTDEDATRTIDCEPTT
jgi:hypothetical protein